MPHHAFIFYSHSAGARLAPLQQSALERLGTPWWRRAALRVLRDDASVPASAALWSGIESAFTRSQHLVLLVSASSAASSWIDREVRWWLAHRQRDKLLIAITVGEIFYDNGSARFDFSRRSCLPAAALNAALFGTSAVRASPPDLTTLKSPAAWWWRSLAAWSCARTKTRALWT